MEYLIYIDPDNRAALHEINAFLETEGAVFESVFYWEEKINEHVVRFPSCLWRIEIPPDEMRQIFKTLKHEMRCTAKVKAVHMKTINDVVNEYENRLGQAIDERNDDKLLALINEIVINDAPVHWDRFVDYVDEYKLKRSSKKIWKILKSEL